MPTDTAFSDASSSPLPLRARAFFSENLEQSHLLVNCFPASLHHWPGLRQTWARVPATDTVWGVPAVMREGARCRHGGGWRLSGVSQGGMPSSSFPSASLPSIPGFPWHRGQGHSPGPECQDSKASCQSMALWELKVAFNPLEPFPADKKLEEL